MMAERVNAAVSSVANGPTRLQNACVPLQSQSGITSIAWWSGAEWLMMSQREAALRSG